jgi:hypothetical protein
VLILVGMGAEVGESDPGDEQGGDMRLMVSSRVTKGIVSADRPRLLRPAQLDSSPLTTGSHDGFIPRVVEFFLAVPDSSHFVLSALAGTASLLNLWAAKAATHLCA